MDIMHKRLVELLAPRGTITELAKYLGVHPNTVGGWKSELSDGFMKYLAQISDFFGVTLDWLFGLTDDKNGHKKTHSQCVDELDVLLFNSLKEMTPQEILRVLAFVERLKSERK